MAEVAAVEVDQDRAARGAATPPVEVETVAPTRVAVGDVARPPYRSSEEWEREEHDPAPGQAAAVSHVRVEVVTPGCAQLSREGVLHNGARPQAPSDEDGRDSEARRPDGGRCPGGGCVEIALDERQEGRYEQPVQGGERRLGGHRAHDPACGRQRPRAGERPDRDEQPHDQHADRQQVADRHACLMPAAAGPQTGRWGGWCPT